MEKLNLKKFEKMEIEKSHTLTLKGGDTGTRWYLESTPKTDTCASEDVEVKLAR